MGKKKGNIFGVPLLFCLNLLFHVDELALHVVEFILQESQFLRGDNVYSKAVFHLPAPLQRDDSLIDEGSDVGMYMQVELANTYLVDKAVNLAL